MKIDLKKIGAFAVVWFCSGVVMDAYQSDNNCLAFIFTVLSLMHFVLLRNMEEKDD